MLEFYKQAIAVKGTMILTSKNTWDAYQFPDEFTNDSDWLFDEFREKEALLLGRVDKIEYFTTFCLANGCIVHTVYS